MEELIHGGAYFSEFYGIHGLDNFEGSHHRDVIRKQGFPPAAMNVAFGYHQRKISPKKTPSCLIQSLHVVFIKQLEIFLV